ncbi:MAG: hypothetical protein Q4A49_00110 [Neisseria sp.]|nr:hypothetical protein [Neisseria sp.]
MPVILAVIAAVAALTAAMAQSFGSIGRFSGHAADRNAAAHLADAALQAGAAEVRRRRWTAEEFRNRADAVCSNGLCAVGETALKRRCLGKSGGSKRVLCLIENGRIIKTPLYRAITGENKDAHAPRYAVELLGGRNGVSFYRISAWARGRNPHTQVLRETYLRIGGSTESAE